MSSFQNLLGSSSGGPRSYSTAPPSQPSTSFTGRSSTPHPSSVPGRPLTSASRSRSVVSSSYNSGHPRHTSTASGRKSRGTSSLWGSDPSEIVCAISEARSISPTVGLAFVNLTTSEAVLSQICDTQFYVKTIHKIQMYEPSAILLVNTAFPPNPKSNLLSIIEEELSGTTVESVDRKYWSEHAGVEGIQTLAFKEDLEAIHIAIQGNFYATCAFAAVSRTLIRAMKHVVDIPRLSSTSNTHVDCQLRPTRSV